MRFTKVQAKRERGFADTFDPADCFIGDDLGTVSLGFLKLSISLQDWIDRPIGTFGLAEEVLETELVGKLMSKSPQMPLADERRPIAIFLE